MDTHIVPATEPDAPEVWRLLRELAEYEDKLDCFALTLDGLREHLWGASAIAGALLARQDGNAVGVAVHYPVFPTSSGRPSLFIEDLVVSPLHRRKGIGAALLRACTRVAAERNYGDVRWWALDWNESAMAFYRAVGARRGDAVVVHALDPCLEDVDVR